MSANERDYRDLVERYLDGVATQQEITELNALLVTDEEVAGYFAEFAQLNAMVREESVAMAEGAGDGSEATARKHTSTRRVPVKARASRRPEYGQWAAYALIPLAAAAAVLFTVMGDDGGRPATRDERESVASTSSAASDIWADDVPESSPARHDEPAPPHVVESPTLESHERAPVTVARVDDTADGERLPDALALPVRDDEPDGDAVADGAAAPREHVAYLDSAEGMVEWRRPGSDRWMPAAVGIPLSTGTGLRTKISRAHVVFDSGTELHLNHWTTVVAAATDEAPGIDLSGGEVYAAVADGDEGFWVRTPRGLATDLGTRFGVKDKMNLTTVTVVEGEVEASTDEGSTTLKKNEEVLLIRRSSPPGTVRTARDAKKRYAWTEKRAEEKKYLAGVDVLLVVGEGDETSLETVDQLAYDGLRSQGARVTVAALNDVTDAQRAGADCLAVSVSIPAGGGAEPFRNTPIPLVIWEGWYDLGMRTDFGESQGDIAINDETRVAITLPEHELAAGLHGVVPALSAPDRLLSAMPGPGAVTVVVSASEPHKSLVFAYERGAEMATGLAPARRVHFFANRAMPNFNKNGWRLFYAAIKWAAKDSARPIR